MSLENDIFGHTVDMTTDGITDTYTVGSSIDFPYPAGTSQDVVYLAIAVYYKRIQFAAALNDFIITKYSDMQRLNLMGLYLNAQAQGLLNRLAYLAQILTWQNAVILYAANYQLSLAALTTPKAVFDYAWNFADVPIQDPRVNSTTAVLIPN